MLHDLTFAAVGILTALAGLRYGAKRRASPTDAVCRPPDPAALIRCDWTCVDDDTVWMCSGCQAAKGGRTT